MSLIIENNDPVLSDKINKCTKIMNAYVNGYKNILKKKCYFENFAPKTLDLKTHT